MNRPVLKERYINPDALARQIDELSREPQQEEFAEAVIKQQKLLISALQKKKEGKPLSDEEQAARLDAATRGLNWGEIRQQEALDTYKKQKQNNAKSDLARDKVLRVKREYEQV